MNVNPETERIIVSLIDRDTEEDRTNKPTLVSLFILSTTLVSLFIFGTTLVSLFIFSTTLVSLFIFSTTLVSLFISSTTLVSLFIFSTTLVSLFIFSTTLVSLFIFSTTLVSLFILSMVLLILTLLHSERPKLHTILAFRRAIWSLHTILAFLGAKELRCVGTSLHFSANYTKKKKTFVTSCLLLLEMDPFQKGTDLQGKNLFLEEPILSLKS